MSVCRKRKHQKRESPDEISFDYVVSGMCERQKCQAPFVDIGIDGQPEIIHTLDSASEPVTNMIGAGDALGLQTLQEFEDSKKLLAPDWYFLQY